MKNQRFGFQVSSENSRISSNDRRPNRPRWPKSDQDRPGSPQEAAKSGLRAAKTCPKSAQDHPKNSQERTKRSPRAAKSTRRVPKSTPRTAKTTPRAVKSLPRVRQEQPKPPQERPNSSQEDSRINISGRMQMGCRNRQARQAIHKPYAIMVHRGLIIRIAMLALETPNSFLCLLLPLFRNPSAAR